MALGDGLGNDRLLLERAATRRSTARTTAATPTHRDRCASRRSSVAADAQQRRLAPARVVGPAGAAAPGPASVAERVARTVGRHDRATAVSPARTSSSTAVALDVGLGEVRARTGRSGRPPARRARSSTRNGLMRRAISGSDVGSSARSSKALTAWSASKSVVPSANDLYSSAESSALLGHDLRGLLGVGRDPVEREVPGVDQLLQSRRVSVAGIGRGHEVVGDGAGEVGRAEQHVASRRRSRACTVNGANTPTQSNSPPANAAAAASVLTPWKSMSSSVMPSSARPCRSRKWSTTPASAAIGLALDVVDRRDRLRRR